MPIFQAMIICIQRGPNAFIMNTIDISIVEIHLTALCGALANCCPKYVTAVNLIPKIIV